MAISKSQAATSMNEADAAVQSALRTLDAEGSGITALTAALQSDLAPAFAAATELIRNAKGRLIITGLGKSGHIGRKIAATFASTGTPAKLPLSPFFITLVFACRAGGIMAKTLCGATMTVFGPTNSVSVGTLK